MEESFEKSIRVSPRLLKKLAEKSNLRGWRQTLSHLSAIFICTLGLIFTWGSVFAVPFFLFQGILINCLYAGVHELSHNTVFKTRALNEIFGRLFTFILLMGRDQDKFEHFQHHRHTQDVELDAEIVGGKAFTLTSYVLYMSGITYWPKRIMEVLRLAAGQTQYWPWLSAPQLKIVHKEARLMLLGYGIIAVISIWLCSAAALTFWLLPMFVMKCFQNLQNTVEHTGMPHVQDIVVNTRTIKAHPIMHWLLWNMPYHTAHHSYPMVPFYQLAPLHKAVVESLGAEPPTVTHLGFQKHMIRKLMREGTSAYTGKDITAY
ncbi:MAG: fatty acid desaturase [Hellea sp.]